MRNTGATGPRIVVGTDGSDHAELAVRWAADEAVRRGAALEVVHAWLPPYPVRPTDLYTVDLRVQRAAEALAAATVERLRQEVPDLVEVRVVGPDGAPGAGAPLRRRGGGAARRRLPRARRVRVARARLRERALPHPRAVLRGRRPGRPWRRSLVVGWSSGSMGRRRPRRRWRGPRARPTSAGRASTWSTPGRQMVGNPDGSEQASRALLEDMVDGLADGRDGGPPDLMLQSVAGPAVQALDAMRGTGRPARPRRSGSERPPGSAARLGEPAVRASRPMPHRGRSWGCDTGPRDGVGCPRRARTVGGRDVQLRRGPVGPRAARRPRASPRPPAGGDGRHPPRARHRLLAGPQRGARPLPAGAARTRRGDPVVGDDPARQRSRRRHRRLRGGPSWGPRRHGHQGALGRR